MEDFEIKDGVLIKYHGEDTEVIIPDGVNIIGERAFYEFMNMNLQKVIIPESVSIIQEEAFHYCRNLRSVSIPHSVTHIGKGAFSFCYCLTDLNLPPDLKVISDMLFSWCVNLKDIQLPESLTTVGKCAFSGCQKLESVCIPETVTHIGDFAFRYCDSLKKVIIPESVIHIGINAFGNCQHVNDMEYHGVRFSPQSISKQFEENVIFRTIDHIRQFLINAKYESYLPERLMKWIYFLIDIGQAELFQKLLYSGDFLNTQQTEELILYAIEKQAYEIQVMLMHYKHQHFGYEDSETLIRKKFEL